MLAAIPYAQIITHTSRREIPWFKPLQLAKASFISTQKIDLQIELYRNTTFFGWECRSQIHDRRRGEEEVHSTDYNNTTKYQVREHLSDESDESDHASEYTIWNIRKHLHGAADNQK